MPQQLHFGLQLRVRLLLGREPALRRAKFPFLISVIITARETASRVIEYRFGQGGLEVTGVVEGLLQLLFCFL
jgi:hypothetical protein